MPPPMVPAPMTPTRRIAQQKYEDRPAEALLNVAVQENVLVQLENLRTHFVELRERGSLVFEGNIVTRSGLVIWVSVSAKILTHNYFIMITTS